MCLAVPGNIIAFTSEHSATVDMMGVQREISTALTPDAQVGDYVLIHAGFSIQVVSPEEARQTIEIFQEIPSSWARSSTASCLWGPPRPRSMAPRRKPPRRQCPRPNLRQPPQRREYGHPAHSCSGTGAHRFFRLSRSQACARAYRAHP